MKEWKSRKVSLLLDETFEINVTDHAFIDYSFRSIKISSELKKSPTDYDEMCVISYDQTRLSYEIIFSDESSQKRTS